MLSFILSATLTLASSVEVYPGASAVLGKVDYAKECGGHQEAQLFVGRKSTLLYQAPAMPGGTFEFHLMPGPYEIVAINNKGCSAVGKFKLRKNKVSRLRLELSKPKGGRSPAGLGVACPNCGPTMGGGFGSLLLPMPQGYSYWRPFGALSYNNFYYPGLWNRWGLSPMWYPGGGGGGIWSGGAVMGKPNLYIDAPRGTKLKVRIELAKESNMLAAVPEHGNAGWKIDVKDPYQLQVGSAKFGTLFFDYRFDPSPLQIASGFCATPKDVVQEMVSILKRAGFQSYEIKDFTQYWSLKLPPAKTYCVFPQVNEQLDLLAKIVSEPKAQSLTRVNFLVVPYAEGVKPPPKFGVRPKRKWTTRKPASSKAKGGIHLREWAVGFLVQN